MKKSRAPFLFSTLFLFSCASTTNTDDGFFIPDGAARDLRMLDQSLPPDLLMSTDAAADMKPGCPPLGGPDHCGSCGTVCPPGHDDKGTQRTCSTMGLDATCDIACKGEYYDVNGSVDDGCEAIDPIIQDSAMNALAVTLPDVMQDPMEKSNPMNILGKLYGDIRLHDAPPTMRPLGREDWYAVTAIGAGTLNVTMNACLGITSFPQDNMFEVCLSDIGQTTFNANSCKIAVGMGNSVCVFPPAKTDAGSPYYVRVRKLSGTNTSAGYALYLQH